MHIRYLSVFPQIFDSFFATSLIEKGIEKGVITLKSENIRDFSQNKHQQVDDEPYGGGAGLVMKAEPVIACLKRTYDDLQKEYQLTNIEIAVIHCMPSKQVFTQGVAHSLADKYKAIIFICGRYEGIDDRVNDWGKKTYGKNYKKLSLGEFVTLGGETPAMVISEAIVRLVPGVIKEQESWMHESYRPESGGKNIEHPHYTRPQIVEGFSVPEVLLSGNHKNIQTWREGF